MSEQISCSPITEYDVYQVTKLLKAMKFHIGGATASFAAIRNLCSLALEPESNMFISVAKDSRRQIVGVVLGVRDYHRFWRRYFFENPLILPRIGIAKVTKFIRKSRKRRKFSDLDQSDTEDKIEFRSDSVWTDKDDKTVHILLIIVDNSHRHKKIGQHLYEAFLEHLKDAGMRKVIARIGYANVPSIYLHQKSGWNVYGVKRHIEAVYDLTEDLQKNQE